MFETIAVILVVMWLVGLLTSYTFGGLVHLVLLLALIILFVRLLQRRKI